MKKIVSAIVIIALVLAGCKKENENLLDDNLQTQQKSLWPQNPLPPQITITNPVAKFVVVNGCSGYEWPKVSTDTVQLKYSVVAGRTWSGTPDKLSKIRVVVDNSIVKEFIVTGQSYSETYIANLPVNGLSVPFDPTKEWHSLGITVWQKDGNLASNCLYVWTTP